jgi:hypothetical protein
LPQILKLPKAQLLAELCDVVLYVHDETPFLAAIQDFASQAATEHLLIEHRTERAMYMDTERGAKRPDSGTDERYDGIGDLDEDGGVS